MKPAMTAPVAEPVFQTPVAKARSFGSNHSRVALVEPGQLPASPSPRKKRQAPKEKTPRAAAVAIPASDQIVTVSAIPSRVPIRSMTQPEPVCAIA
jgi:hypothetical protein